MDRYRDRIEAGQVLAKALKALALGPDAVVVGLARGGVPVAGVIAESLHIPLDLMIVRKLGVPGNEELAMGALAPGGFRVLNEEVVRGHGLGPQAIEAETEIQLTVMREREERYRGDRAPMDVRGRTVILVDDGLATGATLRAAIGALRSQGPRAIFVAVPVGSPEACADIEREVEGLICPLRPAWFMAVGAWYESFDQTTDKEVRSWMARGSGRLGGIREGAGD